MRLVSAGDGGGRVSIRALPVKGERCDVHARLEVFFKFQSALSP